MAGWSGDPPEAGHSAHGRGHLGNGYRLDTQAEAGVVRRT
jgi:hypothetical protein